MQLFAQLPDDRLVVLEASPLETAGDVARRLEGEEQRSQANHCGGHTNHCRGAAEPLMLGERRLVKGGFTLPEHSTLDDCGVVAGDTLWLQARLRGGSSTKKQDDDEEEKEKEEDDVSRLVHAWNLVTGKTQGSSGPLVPMTLYMVLLQSGLLFSQISATFMVISNWGVE